jgi:hypothetical protein
MLKKSLILFIAAWAGLAAAAAGREWTDSTGKYHTQADMVGFNEKMVILKKENHDLVAVPLDKLSEQDLKYLKSEEAEKTANRAADQMQTWTMRSGLMVVGKVVSYGRKDVTIQRRRGKVYVNDRLLDNMPEVYKVMLPKIVSYFENSDLTDKKKFDEWILKLKSDAKTYTCDGVILELENGDEYGVPFFFFSEDDLKVLQPGWDKWLAAAKETKAEEERQQQSFMLQAAAQAYQQDRQANQQISMMQFEMLVASNMGDLWEVRLMPGPGVAGMPMCVVVPGTNSATAAQAAMMRYPGYVVGPVSRAH